MLTLSGRTITLDIGSTAIRLLATRGRRVERWASASLEQGLVREGLITDPLALGASVRRLMESSGMTGRTVIASVSGLYSVCRLLHIPVSQGKLTGQVVLEAAKAATAVPEEEFYYSWWMVGPDEIGQRVFVVCLPRDVVDSEVRALRSAGIRPHVLNLRALALMRLADQQPALIVNMDLDTLDAVLMVAGIPQIMRTISRRQDVLLDEWVEHLAQVLEQTISFYESRHPECPLGRAVPLFLGGPLADNAEVVAMLQDRTHYPTAPLSIPLQYPPNLPITQYAVNIGLALGQMSLPQVKEVDEAIPDGMAISE